jgi:hypothetical protein
MSLCAPYNILKGNVGESTNRKQKKNGKIENGKAAGSSL